VPHFAETLGTADAVSASYPVRMLSITPKQTRAEHDASPNTVQMSMNVGDRLVIALTPAVRPRATLTHTVGELTEDSVALLRRAYNR